jgi:mRNA interferase RelE/StbE
LQSWRIEIKPSAEKQYLRLDRKTRQRIREALGKLEKSETPLLLLPHVKALTGKLKGDYRVRIGDWRVLLTPDRESRVLRVYAILPRSGAY